MTSLYNLSEKYKRVLDLRDDGVDEEVIKDTLELLDDEIENKADNYAYIIRETKGQIETIDNEIKRLQELKRSRTNFIKYLQENLFESMERTGKTKFKTSLNSFWIQANPLRLEIESEDNIPTEFFEFKRQVNKKELLEYAKENEIDGVSIKQTKGVRMR